VVQAVEVVEFRQVEVVREEQEPQIRVLLEKQVWIHSQGAVVVVLVKSVVQTEHAQVVTE
jgi:hypothetical protein